MTWRADDVSLSVGPWTGPLARCPHVLIAGATGSGKSNLLHGLIAQLVAYPPARVRLQLVDPKRVELALWVEVPHLWLTPARTLPEVDRVLEQLEVELEHRYRVLERLGLRDVAETWTRAESSPLGRLVVVVDEFATLTLALDAKLRRRLTGRLILLAQQGRAAGVHLIVATQYPTRECVPSLLKVNVPTRACLRVPQAVSSRTILDRAGAEKLKQPGDLLVLTPEGELLSGRAPYFSDEELRRAARLARASVPPRPPIPRARQVRRRRWVFWKRTS